MRPLLLALAGVLALAAPASAQLTASEVGEPANGPAVFRFPQAIAYSPGGQGVIVGDEYSARIGVYDRSGALSFTFGSRALAREPGRVGVVGGVASDPAGHIFVLDSENDRVLCFELLMEVAKAARFDGAAWRVILRIKIQDDVLPGEGCKIDARAVVRGE